MIVVDVTVLAYFLIEGPETRSVLQLHQRNPNWAAPSLWRAEFMNVLWKYLRNGTIDMNTALERMEIATDILSETTFGVRPDEVLPLSELSGCTAYDCHYVALAHRLHIPLATHDRKLLQAFPETAAHPDDL